MNIKKITFQGYLLFLILLVVIISVLTYYYSDYLFRAANGVVEEDLNKKIKLINTVEDFYFDLNSSLNMDDFFFPSFSTPSKRFESLDKNKLINNDIFKDLWIEKENLFNLDIEKASDSFVDQILEQAK